MGKKNIMATKDTAESVIGNFDFSDIEDTGLKPEIQALICKGDGTSTRRWQDNMAVVKRLRKATLGTSKTEFRKRLT